MKNLYFDDFEDLACDIADKFDIVKDDFGDVSIIAKYEEAKEIIAELSCIGYSLESIRMSRPEWENYNDEYLISLNNDGIWCEQMKSDGKYLTDESTITYILGNCSSKVIPYCNDETVYEVTVDEDDLENEERFIVNGKPATKEEFNEYVSQFKKSDDKSIIAVSKESYTINGKPVTKEEFDKRYEKFEKILLDFYEFRDEICRLESRLFRW